MRTAAVSLVLALIWWGANAEDKRLDMEAFLDLMDGKTGYFTLNGAEYGSEAYHPDRRVIWRDTDGQCQEGTWRRIAQYMCFQYGSVSCWEVFETEDGNHYAVEESGLRVEFDRITEGAFDCQGIPLG
jgi:hypothetical protein